MTAHRRLVFAAAALLAGCAPLQAPQRAHLAAEERCAARLCARGTATSTPRSSAPALRDAQATRVPGYPYLRLDRFTASFAGQAWDARVFDALLARARALDARRAPSSSPILRADAFARG